MTVAVDARLWIFHFSRSSYSSSISPYKLNTIPNPLPLRRNEATTVKCIAASSTEKLLSLPVKEIKERSKTWLWRGHTVAYLIYPELQIQKDNTTSLPHNPLLLIHGFGASIAHWRRNIATLSENHTVFAIDLLGFGASDKPEGFVYSTEIWAELIQDFLDEIIQTPTVLIGNSIGSLSCLIASAAAAANNRNSLIRGLVLLNCAGGMNNKATVDDWRIKLLLPLFLLIDFLLRQKWIASFIFNGVKNRDRIRSILMSVYGNKESVDEELVDIILEPANDEGALDAFVAIVTGEPGPTPLQLIPRIAEIPVLVLWGDQDPFTPLDGPVGKYFTSIAKDDQLSKFDLFVLEGVGHCPHDDRPDSVHSRLLPWLQNLSIHS